MTLNSRWMDGFLQISMALALLNFAAKNVSLPRNFEANNLSFMPQLGNINSWPVYSEKPLCESMLMEQLLSLEASFQRKDIQPSPMLTLPTTFAGPMPFHRQSSCDSDELSLLSASDSSAPTDSFYHPEGSPFYSAPSPFSFTSTTSSGVTSHDLSGSDDLTAFSPGFTLNDFDLDLLDVPTNDENNLLSGEAKQQFYPHLNDLSGLEVALAKLQHGSQDVKLVDNSNLDDVDFELDFASASSLKKAKLSIDDRPVYFDANGLPIFPGQDQFTDDDINDLLASSFPSDESKVFASPPMKSLPIPYTEKFNQATAGLKSPFNQPGFDFLKTDWENKSSAASKSFDGLTESEVTDMPVEKFNSWIKTLDAIQMEIAKDLRRKGKNKLAARNCRKRKFDAVGDLESQIDELKLKQDLILREREMLLSETKEFEKSTEWLRDHIFESLRDDKGRRFSKEEFTLQYTTDGSVYLVPKQLNLGNGQGGSSSDKK